jgi:hypothetical protein
MDTIPTEIFQIIQDFSTEADYRSLVNVCKAGFNSVKKTVRYSLTFNTFTQIDEKTKAEYQKLISSVKCKSKQISLTFTIQKC